MHGLMGVVLYPVYSHQLPCMGVWELRSQIRSFHYRFLQSRNSEASVSYRLFVIRARLLARCRCDKQKTLDSPRQTPEGLAAGGS